MKMSDDELMALVESMRGSALGFNNDTLTIDREKALDHYFGRKYGNEIEGRSAVVERTVMETVEWALPQILRALCTSDALAKFNPRGPEDVEQAEQETDYINYLIMEQNDGFIVLHDAIKDALLLKNGYIKRYWKEYSSPHIQRYSGLDEMAVTQLLTGLEQDNDKVEVLGKDVQMVDMNGQPTPVYDLEIRVTRTKGKTCVEAVPAEEILVSPRCRGSLQDTDFVGHVPPMTRADMIDMGMDKDFVDSLPAKNMRQQKPDAIARDTLNQNAVGTYEPNNPIMEDVDYLEAYVRVDYDGDGVAELRKVIVAGGKIPPGPDWNEEVEEVPFSYVVPSRMPHRHVGISFDDLVSDLQKIRTALLRSMLDNVNLTNNQRPIINERVEQSDVLLSAPGSPIRVEGREPVNGSLEFWAPEPILQQIMPVLDYLDDRKEMRTGIGKNNTVMDSDVLRDSAKETVAQAFSAANQKIELITRLIAEGIKDLVRGVHGITVRNQDEAAVVNLRGQWVNINPREWQTRDDLSVSVGLGVGSMDENKARLMMLGTVMKGADSAGIVTPENVYAFATEFANQLGFKEKAKFFTNPKQMPPKHPPPDPVIEATKIQSQEKLQAAHIKAQTDLQTAQIKAQSDIAQHQADHQRKSAMDAGSLTVEQQKMIMNFVADLVTAELAAKREATPEQVSADVRGAVSDAREMV